MSQTESPSAPEADDYQQCEAEFIDGTWYGDGCPECADALERAHDDCEECIQGAEYGEECSSAMAGAW